MILARGQLRPLFKTHGGKAYLARRIIAHFPPHRVYIEPFAGGLSVLLNKPSAEIEVASDLHGDLIATYCVLRDRPEDLIKRLDAVDYSRATFDRAAVQAPKDELDAAVRFLVCNRMSRGGLGRTFAWSDRSRGGRPGDLNAWETIKTQLPSVARRLRQVEFRHQDALDVIREFDAPDVLHYCDPPYLHSTRTSKQTYAYEMTEEQHVRLLEILIGCRGFVILSGYLSDLYDGMLSRWNWCGIDMPNHSGQGRNKQRRMEVLWKNF
jgi:DNA adenine methylase